MKTRIPTIRSPFFCCPNMRHTPSYTTQPVTKYASEAAIAAADEPQANTFLSMRNVCALNKYSTTNSANPLIHVQ